MEVIETNIPEVKILKPKLFGDERGFFYGEFQSKRFQ
jgi:dTDP-4-dehydrorhamnose 3,5-epimerase